MVARDMQGRFILGRAVAALAAAAGETAFAAGPVLTHLRDVTGESAQLYRRQGRHAHRPAAPSASRACGTRSRSAPRSP